MLTALGVLFGILCMTVAVISIFRKPKHKVWTPDDVLDSDPVAREVIARAANSPGRIITATRQDDGSVLFKETEQ